MHILKKCQIAVISFFLDGTRYFVRFVAHDEASSHKAKTVWRYKQGRQGWVG